MCVSAVWKEGALSEGQHCASSSFSEITEGNMATCMIHLSVVYQFRQI